MTQTPDDDRIPAIAPASLWKRLLWFVALWLGGFLALGVVAYAIRLGLKK